MSGTAVAIGTAGARGTALPRRELAGTAGPDRHCPGAGHCPDGGHCEEKAGASFGGTPCGASSLARSPFARGPLTHEAGTESVTHVAHAGTSRREYSNDALSFGAGRRDALHVAHAGTTRHVAPSSASRREAVAPVPPTRRASLGPGRHDARTSLAAGRRDAPAAATLPVVARTCSHCSQATRGKCASSRAKARADLFPNPPTAARSTPELLCPASTEIPRTPRALLATELPAERSRWKSSKRSFPATLQRVPTVRPPAAGNRFAPRPAGTLGALPSAPGSELPPRGSVRRRRRKGAGEAPACLRGALARSVARSGAPSPGSARKGAWCVAGAWCAPSGTLQVATCLAGWCKLASDGTSSDAAGREGRGGGRREAAAHRQCARRARGGRSVVGARACVRVRAGAPAEGAARRVPTGGGEPMGGGAHRSVLSRPRLGGVHRHPAEAGSARVALAGDAAVPRRGHGARGRDAGARNLPDAGVSDRRARGTERCGLRAGREDESHRAGAPNASPLVGVFSGCQPLESACRARRSAGGSRQYKDRWPRKHRLRGHCGASTRGDECGAAVESERNQRLALGWGQHRSVAASFGVEPSERVVLASASAAGLVCVRSMRASEGDGCRR